MVKTASANVLRGEIFFYHRMPKDIAHLFPAMVASFDGRGDTPSSVPSSPKPESIASLTLQRIKGVTFSHLVTNRCLTPGRLTLFLRALRAIHSSAGDPDEQVEAMCVTAV